MLQPYDGTAIIIVTELVLGEYTTQPNVTMVYQYI